MTRGGPEHRPEGGNLGHHNFRAPFFFTTFIYTSIKQKCKILVANKVIGALQSQN